VKQGHVRLLDPGGWWNRDMFMLCDLAKLTLWWSAALKPGLRQDGHASWLPAVCVSGLANANGGGTSVLIARGGGSSGSFKDVSVRFESSEWKGYKGTRDRRKPCMSGELAVMQLNAEMLRKPWHRLLIRHFKSACLKCTCVADCLGAFDCHPAIRDTGAHVPDCQPAIRDTGAHVPAHAYTQAHNLACWHGHADEGLGGKKDTPCTNLQKHSEHPVLSILLHIKSCALTCKSFLVCILKFTTGVIS